MLRAILGTFIDFVVPPRRTERLVEEVTADEWSMLQTSSGLPYHDARVRALVWELKYFGTTRATATAAGVLAERVLECAAEEIGRPLLLPVPMHANRRRARGHNQTEALCQALLPYLGNVLEYRTDGIARVVDTPHQQGLARAKRLNNVRNSMHATAVVKDRVCIVVDDVTTTGATLEEAERAVYKAGARTVYTLALAYS